MAELKQYKVVLLGDSGVGKTTLVKYMLTGKIKEETPTLGVGVYPFHNIQIWDCAGDDRVGGLRDGYFINSELAIVLYKDKKNKKWEKLYKDICPNGDVYYVENKDNNVEQIYKDVKFILEPLL